MPLVKNGKVVGDPFTTLADDAAFSDGGHVLVSASRFLADPVAILSRAGTAGVIWPNSRDVDDLVPHLAALAAVALVFPTYKDGRAYTQARLLRERHGFKGELRATGQVLRDQFIFMIRAGFDAFDVKKESDAEAFASVATRYSVFYQPTGDGRVTAFGLRLARHAEVTNS